MKKKISPAWLLRGAFLVLTVVLGVFLAVRAVGNAAARANREGGYAPGVYTASANGFGGVVDVTVTIGDKGGITDVTAAAIFVYFRRGHWMERSRTALRA